MRTPLLAFALSIVAFAAHAQTRSSLDIDATDLPRGLLHATQTFSLEAGSGALVLRYPQWVPGSHAPGGPIQNLAGLNAFDQDGGRLAWSRTPGDVYRIEIDTAPTTTSITLDIRYIANQPTANSRGLDSFGSQDMGLISPNTVLFYPEDTADTEFMVETSLTIPESWSAACALDQTQTTAGEPGPVTLAYAPVTLRRLVDTPILIGRYYKSYSLNEEGVDAPRHTLHVISELPGGARPDDEIIAAYTHMVTQAAHMFGSFPFESMDILLGITDQLPRNGLEHLRSTMNILPPSSFEDFDSLKGWDQMLIPHEYVHAWCGKYLRPEAMATTDFHTPKGTELLWVYEGLTTYLAEVLENRAGLFDEGEYEWALRNSLRRHAMQQGRDWRPLSDTCAASHTLRGGSANWGHLRRGQDYYGEGALIWMEADAIIRRLTEGERTLDDFCRRFFHAEGWTDDFKTYTETDVIDTMNAVAEYDWQAFFDARIRGTGGKGPMSLAGELGYAIQYTNEPPKGPDGSEGHDPLDARESLGLSVAGDGTVRTVMLGTPADAAGLGPGMKILGLTITTDGVTTDHTWSRNRFVEAVESSVATGGLGLLVVSGDTITTRRLTYDQGPRYMTLVRTDEANTTLADILAPVRVE